MEGRWGGVDGFRNVVSHLLNKFSNLFYGDAGARVICWRTRYHTWGFDRLDFCRHVVESDCSLLSLDVVDGAGWRSKALR